MSLIRIITRSLMAITAAVVVLAVAGPWSLYFVGMNGVAGRPSPPEQLASPESQLKMWTSARGVGAPEIPFLNPYSYVSAVLDGGPNKPGMLVAWRVASDFLQEHQRYRGKIWWHLSGAALTIWLTRNWTPEQLLSVKPRGSAD
jgi:hypothetical protein